MVLLVVAWQVEVMAQVLPGSEAAAGWAPEKAEVVMVVAKVGTMEATGVEVTVEASMEGMEASRPQTFCSAAGRAGRVLSLLLMRRKSVLRRGNRQRSRWQSLYHKSIQQQSQCPQL